MELREYKKGNVCIKCGERDAESKHYAVLDSNKTSYVSELLTKNGLKECIAKKCRNCEFSWIEKAVNYRV